MKYESVGESVAHVPARPARESAREEMRPVPGPDADCATVENGRERILAAAAQRGDPAAFRELYDAYRDRIWSVVVYSIGDPLQAQDVLQTVFFKAYRGLRGFRFQSSLFTWLYRIARNECRNFLRRRPAPCLPLDAILGSGDEIERRPIPDAAAARDLILQDAVRQLPFKMREVVVLKYVEGMSYEEMSRTLGCAPGTVASRLNRALAELGDRLQAFRRIL
jgi:RNA polymerase sigma-70 factor (ECF subfamily)